MRAHFVVTLLITGLCVAGQAHAITVPSVEHFQTGHANWFNASGAAPVNWLASGGPDGSSFVSTSFNFVNQTPGLPFPNNAVSLFRAQDEFNSSDHAFEGDWIGAGVSQFNFRVRHNAPTAMNFFVRFATASNSPAWSGVAFAPVGPNQWTQVTINIAFGDPGLFFEGPPPTINNFNQVFGNIGHVQIGVFGGDMAGVNQEFTFDLDQPSIVPAPGLLSGLGLFALLRRSRKR